MTAAEIQQKILDETGIKTSVSVIKKGSMTGYARIRPMFQGGEYPNIPFDFIQKLKAELKDFDCGNFPVFCSISEIHVYDLQDDRIEMKRERKPKEIGPDTPVKKWGSKNSQLRLDKATRRYAKRLKKGGCARYY